MLDDWIGQRLSFVSLDNNCQSSFCSFVPWLMLQLFWSLTGKINEYSNLEGWHSVFTEMNWTYWKHPSNKKCLFKFYPFILSSTHAQGATPIRGTKGGIWAKMESPKRVITALRIETHLWKRNSIVLAFTLYFKWIFFINRSKGLHLESFLTNRRKAHI